MSNSSEFCGDHVNLFRGFLARMSHPNKLPITAEQSLPRLATGGLCRILDSNFGEHSFS